MIQLDFNVKINIDFEFDNGELPSGKKTSLPIFVQMPFLHQAFFTYLK